jgi:formylmethanofuran dehydrogenase subunit E
MCSEQETVAPVKCADCGDVLGAVDGWQLEDGRTVCHGCCVVDLQRAVANLIRRSW